MAEWTFVEGRKGKDVHGTINPNPSLIQRFLCWLKRKFNA